MSSTDRHIIHKLTVEVTTPSIREGYAIRNNVRSFIDLHVVPAVEHYIDELGSALGDREFLQIDRLDISVDTDQLDLDSSGLPAAIREQIAQAMKRKKQELPAVRSSDVNDPFYVADSAGNAEGMRKLSAGVHGIQTLFYFLEHGSRPWWSDDPGVFNAVLEEKKLLQLAAEERSFRQQFFRKILLSPVRKRLVRQFSDTFLVQVLLIVQTEHPSAVPKPSRAFKDLLEKIFGNSSASLREAVWQVVLTETVRRMKGQPQPDAVLLRELIALFAPFFKQAAQAAPESSDEQQLAPGTSLETYERAPAGGISGPGKKATGKTVRSVSLPEERALQVVQLIHLLIGTKEPAAYYSRLIEPIVRAAGTGKVTSSAAANPATGPKAVPKRKHNDNNPQQKEEDRTDLSVQEQQPATTDGTTPADAVTIPDPDANAPAGEQKTDEPVREIPQKDPEHIVVDNAGLVLVHPFIRQLFLTIGLLDEQKQLKDRVLAAHVLHYLATGIECDFEHTMQFEKYLTGIPFTESIERNVQLSDTIKQETEALLVSVKQNWKAMAGSSPQAIRETFLQRSGKLMNDTQPRLVVERKTVDILLDQLPWGMSIVKLPWMEHMIFVEW